ncbi:MAG: phosphomannomutase/phosphoglucomutase [Bacteroidota bacterium]
MNAFKAYDIRGVYNKDFNKEDVYKIGFFLPQVLMTKRVLVGRDMRDSSPEIYSYLCKGINAAGADVYNIGLTTTPMVYFATAKYHFNASVQITASHNPKEYNGLKVSRENAMPVGYDSGLREIEELMLTKRPMVTTKQGKIVDVDIRQEYIEFLSKYTPDISNLKISIDCSNGMAALLIKDILGKSPKYLFDTLDGTFPNHEANPLEIENVQSLIKSVKKNKSDIGIIFDGDADRVMFVDNLGNFISPDLIIALLGHYFLEGKDIKENVLQDIRSSKAVGEYLKKMGGTMTTWRVGRAFAAPKLSEINGIYGGELAGHYYFRNFFYSDSGILASLLVLNVVGRFKEKGISLAKLISNISSYANSGELNFKIKDKTNAMRKVCEFFMQEEKHTAFYDFDGYRVEFPKWWFNIRPSNTEPYLRFIAEATTKEKLDDIIKKLHLVLAPFQ